MSRACETRCGLAGVAGWLEYAQLACIQLSDLENLHVEACISANRNAWRAGGGDLRGQAMQIIHPSYPGRWVGRSYSILSLPVKW